MRESGNGIFVNGAIRIAADNQIALTNVWRWLGDGDTNNTEILGVNLSSGTWHLEKSDPGWYIVSEYKKENGHMTIYLRLVGETPPYEIQIYNWQTGAPYYFEQGTN